MATGDLPLNCRRVADWLAKISYPQKVSRRLLQEGDPSVLLPVVHFALLNYSPHVVRKFGTTTLHDKDDASFVDAVWRLAILQIGIHPGLNARQFLSAGFVERKLIFIVDLIQAVIHIHEEAERSAAARHAVRPYTSHLIPSAGADFGLAERTPPEPRANDLLPPRATDLPVSARPPVAPQPSRLRQPRVKAGVKTGRLYSTSTAAQAPSQTEVFQFLSDAVALGEGAHASVAARRKATLAVASGTGAAAAGGTTNGIMAATIQRDLVSSAGWRERVAREVEALRQAADASTAGRDGPGTWAGVGQGQGQQFNATDGNAPAAVSPSRLPVHRERLPGGVLSRLHGSPGMSSNLGSSGRVAPSSLPQPAYLGTSQRATGGAIPPGLASLGASLIPEKSKGTHEVLQPAHGHGHVGTGVAAGHFLHADPTVPDFEPTPMPMPMPMAAPVAMPVPPPTGSFMAAQAVAVAAHNAGLPPAAAAAATTFNAVLDRTSAIIAGNLAGLEARLAALEGQEKALRAAAEAKESQKRAEQAHPQAQQASTGSLRYASLATAAPPMHSTARNIYSYLPTGYAEASLARGMDGRGTGFTDPAGSGDSTGTGAQEQESRVSAGQGEAASSEFEAARKRLLERRAGQLSSSKAGSAGAGLAGLPPMGSSSTGHATLPGQAQGPVPSVGDLTSFLATISARVAATDAAIARSRPMLDHAARLAQGQ